MKRLSFCEVEDSIVKELLQDLYENSRGKVLWKIPIFLVCKDKNVYYISDVREKELVLFTVDEFVRAVETGLVGCPVCRMFHHTVMFFVWEGVRWLIESIGSSYNEVLNCVTKKSLEVEEDGG